MTFSPKFNIDVRDVPDMSATTTPQCFIHSHSTFSQVMYSDRAFSRENVNVCCSMITTTENSMDMNAKND
jgi:hypothetical protein